MVWREEMARTKPFKISRQSLIYFSLKQSDDKKLYSITVSYWISSLFEFEVRKFLQDFPSSHVFFVGLMYCTICSRSSNHDNTDKEISDVHMTHLSPVQMQIIVVESKLKIGHSVQWHVCPVCLLFCRTCLERSNSSLRISCWSGLLPMFAPTEYLMTFVATCSFFCAVLMRETWIWCVLRTLVNS